MPEIFRPEAYLAGSEIALAADQPPVTTAATTLGCDQTNMAPLCLFSLHPDRLGRGWKPRAHRLLIRGGAGQKVPAGDDICPQPAGEVGRINQACDTAVLHETSVWSCSPAVIWRVDAGRGPAVTEDMGPAGQTDPVYAARVAGWGQ